MLVFVLEHHPDRSALEPLVSICSVFPWTPSSQEMEPPENPVRFRRADVRRLVGGCAAAVRSLHAAVSPEPGDAVVGLSVDQINRRFAAAGLEGRRTSHRGRVGLAVELTARGASTHAIQLAGGWKDPAMVVRYAASVSTREGAVSKYLR